MEQILCKLVTPDLEDIQRSIQGRSTTSLMPLTCARSTLYTAEHPEPVPIKMTACH